MARVSDPNIRGPAPEVPTRQPDRWATDPFRLGTSEQFAALRRWLTAVGFTEAGLAAPDGIWINSNSPPAGERAAAVVPITDTRSLLTQLFLEGLAVPFATVDSILAPAERSMLDDLGLLQPAIADPMRCVGTVALYPMENIYLASDRHGGLEWVGQGVAGDIVYSALTPETHRFVRLLPRARCTEYLELCAGTGVAAILAGANFADHAWAVDITERATRFAGFNARLNGLGNVITQKGDLYQPVAGRTFDVIVAHPPYVPSFTNNVVFRDGGEDGEQVTRRILGGLAEHLRPGGQFYCDCTMTDRRGAPLEQRVRRMLGTAESEFDVLVAQSRALDPVEQYGQGVRSGRSTPEEFARQLETFERLEIEAFVSAVILIRRRTSVGTVITARRMLSDSTTAAHLQWLLGYLVGTADWTEADIARILDTMPRCLPTTEVRTRSSLRNGVWTVAGSQLATAAPFAVMADCPPWFQALLGGFDGKTKARAHFDRLRRAAVVPDLTSDRQCAALVRQLADGGFIELEMFPLP
ncbi:MAG TPA: class I SAM-dependent methyltransferase [Gemmatimonadaceae bacterium]